jgi:hypothetical protein
VHEASADGSARVEVVQQDAAFAKRLVEGSILAIAREQDVARRQRSGLLAEVQVPWLASFSVGETGAPRPAPDSLELAGAHARREAVG